MAKGHKGPGMGRPKIEINDKLFDILIQLPLIKEDIAKCLGCGIDTLQTYCQKRFGTTFSVLSEQNRQTFRKNIIGKQYEMAMKGDRCMLIWLGKQYCGQSEKIEQKVEQKSIEFKIGFSDEGL